MRAFLSGLSFVLLTGCATSGANLVASGKQDLDAAPVCCKTLATAKVAKLPLEKTTVVVDKTAQAFDFGGNKAFFRLYELPAFAKTYSVVITSEPDGTLADLALFLPRVTFYDAQFQPTRHFDEKTLRNRGNSAERTVFINPQNASEKFVAVYGSDLSASIERAYSMVTVTPVMAGPYMFNMYGGQDGKSTIRSAPTGRFELEVQGLQSQ
jgi:hypothetical protein